ncbi:MAG: DUF5655 domain-containing protein [Bacteroidota bacterium]
MWTCPNCHRPFQVTNQSHICNDTTIDDIFAGKSDNVVLAFDEVLLATAEWEPNIITAATKAVVFTNKRAWLIVRPLTKALDVSFYTGQAIVHPHVRRSAPMGKTGKKFRHTVRLNGPGELLPGIVDLLREGFEFGNR